MAKVEMEPSGAAVAAAGLPISLTVELVATVILVVAAVAALESQ